MDDGGSGDDGDASDGSDVVCGAGRYTRRGICRRSEVLGIRRLYIGAKWDSLSALVRGWF